MVIEDQERSALGCSSSGNTVNLMGTVILEVKQAHFSCCFSVELTFPQQHLRQICETGPEVIFFNENSFSRGVLALIQQKMIVYTGLITD